MVRRRWPEVVIVLALVALAAGGALAIWHRELFALLRGDPLEEPTPAPPRPGAVI